MDNRRTRLREEGLARTTSWTRRTAAGAAVLCAALAGIFAHALPGQAATPGTAQPGSTQPSQPHLQAPAQPPGSGSGAGGGHVTSGGS
ncbi:hypothetical protein P3T37_006284 [Kitasatospora sp. MAA4]|uniref:hypothetical protein n=1 Tax=Kitasatospora sp. MAA4 TaxID=3035093 RepID=UPI00247674B4|nr:hypothetical protein [Kitasatospora sp. MAA4]MDH6136853.1 hypothetical protein [Kitasatospora sp. MAA4]